MAGQPDAYITALGGPSALKIPGTIKAGLVSGAVTVVWTGGVALEQADSPRRAVDDSSWDRRPVHLHAFASERGEILSPADTLGCELGRFGGLCFAEPDNFEK